MIGLRAMRGRGHCTFQLYKLRAALKDGISFVCPFWFVQRTPIVLWVAFSQRVFSLLILMTDQLLNLVGPVSACGEELLRPCYASHNIRHGYS
jgi:hypothetical protein